ncbi:MAG: glycosyltransferase family 39 protein, partial [Dehalococcoidia bacterium]|nr:glycosyltransferase family 39 protein [Dehalococcoidia bacterium]
MRASRTAFWIWPLLALAFGLRVLGLPGLQVSGDDAWSVYLALKDLPALTWATAIDSHPPLYYYLLHFWMAATGVTELSVRFPSALTGLLTVAVTYKLGRRVLGPSGGLLAGLLAAISPFLVYFDRMPRMYSLLTFLAALTLYLVFRLMQRPSALHFILYMATILAALYTHYFGVFVMAAGFLVVALAWRTKLRLVLAWAGGHGFVFVLFLPWLLYILGPAVASTTQEYGSIGLPRPPNVLVVAEHFWTALNVGNILEAGQSKLLTLGLSLLWALGLLLVFRPWRRLRQIQGNPLLLVPVTFVVLPLLGSVLAFLVTPYVPFTRLLLFAVPS